MKKQITSSLSAVASFAIMMFVLSYINSISVWFALMLTAIVVGFTSFFLPMLVEKFNCAFSIISTGFTILFMIPFANLKISSEQRYWCLFCIIVFVAVVTDSIISMINHRFSINNIIFDTILCLLANFLINKFSNYIATLVILVIMFTIILLVNFSFHFSFKKNVNKETKQLKENVKNTDKSPINIPIEEKRSSIDVMID